MEVKDYTEANRKAWNEAHPVHQRGRKQSLAHTFRENDFMLLDSTARGILEEVGVTGKRIAQLCCNNALDLLSILTLGAQSGVGFDISEEALKEAQELKNLSQQDACFVCGDIYDISSDYDNEFDLIYVSVGALGNLPDIARFFCISHRLLRKGGHLVIYEMHPFLDTLAAQGEPEFDENDPLKMVYSYFREEPVVLSNGIDYIGKTTYSSHPHYWFHHKLSCIFSAVMETSMTVTHFKEYAHDISSLFGHLEGTEIIPLSYSLIGIR